MIKRQVTSRSSRGGKQSQQADKAAATAAKKVIGRMDDLDKERKALLSELGLDDTGYPKDPNVPIDKAAQDRMTKDFEVDPSAFNVFSRDFKRVDVGLLVQRLPIFMHMRDRDA